MNEKKPSRKLWSFLLAALLVLPGGVLAQNPENAPSKAFSREQLVQLLAPIALYPDSLLTQILMASTYPLEVVKATNWVKQNKELKGDPLTAALEKQEWDPSVKSLVNFPKVLQMMSDQLDWTQKLGDAFLAQQKDVLATVQTLRAKALEAGNLKTTKEQVVVVEKDPQIIIIQQASPQVVYVPAYNPTVVYGVWAYPAYPPYPVYPPGYVAGAVVVGVAVGAAWGYAWGHCDYHGGSVNVNYNQNTNINRNIDRGKYAQQQPARGGQPGSGKWQHDPSHRQGVAYRDSATAKQYGQGSGRQNPSGKDARGYGDRGGAAGQAGSSDRGAKGGAGQAGTSDRSAKGNAGKTGGGSDRGGGGRESAFGGSGSGSQERAASDRGSASQAGRDAGGGMGGGSRGGSGGGGGSRGGGGGRGGGRR